jgi:integrase
VEIKDSITQFLRWKRSYAPRAGKSYPIWLDILAETIPKEIEAITQEDIEIYFTELKNRNYSDTSIEYARTIIKNFFTFLRESGEDVQVNPFFMSKKKIRNNPHKAIDEKIYTAILAQTESMRDSIIIRLLWECGLRVGELTSLNISDISQDGTHATVWSEKTMRQHIITWSAHTKTMLQAYIMGDHPQTIDALIYANCRGRVKRATTRLVQRIVKNYAEDAGYPWVVPHSFRHGKAHKILRDGGDVTDVQKILRHTNPISSFRYLNFNKKEQEERAKKYM